MILNTTDRILSYSPNFQSDRSPDLIQENLQESVQSCETKDDLLLKCKSIIEDLTNEINVEKNFSNLLTEQTSLLRNEFKSVMEDVNKSKNTEQQKEINCQNLNTTMSDIESSVVRANQFIEQKKLDFGNIYQENKAITEELDKNKEIYDNLIKEINQKDEIYNKLKKELNGKREVKSGYNQNEIFQQNTNLK